MTMNSSTEEFWLLDGDKRYTIYTNVVDNSIFEVVDIRDESSPLPPSLIQIIALYFTEGYSNLEFYTFLESIGFTETIKPFGKEFYTTTAPDGNGYYYLRKRDDSFFMRYMIELAIPI